MVLVNNKFLKRNKVKIDIEDRGYQFGDGVYEVIRVYNRSSFRIDEHLQRLKYNMNELNIILPYSLEVIKNKLKKLVVKNNLKNGTIYIQVTRGVSERVHHFPEDVYPILTAYTRELRRPFKKMEYGVNVILTEDIRWKRCDIKSINLLGNIISKQKAKESKCEEAILHRGNIITEGSSTNVFSVRGNIVYTHPANNLILNGITRREVFKIANKIGLEIIESEFTVNELINSDEVFITSTTIEITPVIKIDNIIVNSGEPGPITKEIQKLFDKAIVDNYT